MKVNLKLQKKLIFNLPKSIWKEFIYGGHILSFGASATVLFVIMIVGKSPNIALVAVPYFITQLVYVYNRHKDLRVDMASNPERSKHLIETKIFSKYSVYPYFGLLVLMLIILGSVWLPLFVFMILALGFLYPKHLTKNFIGFKNYYVALLWALAYVTMPFIYYGIPIDNLFVFLFLFVLIRAALNTTFFDLKDLKSDKTEGLKTWPVVIGYNNTLLLLTLYNILSGLVLLFAVYVGVLDIKATVLLLTVHYSFFYLYFAYITDSARTRKISYIMVDGEYIFWPILLVLVGLG